MTHHRVFIQVHHFFIGVELTTNCPATVGQKSIVFCTFVIGSRVLLVIGIYESFHELNSQLISQFSQAGLFEISTTQTFGQLGCGDYKEQIIWKICTFVIGSRVLLVILGRYL